MIDMIDHMDATNIMSWLHTLTLIIIESELCVSIPLCLSQTLRGHKDIRKQNINSYHIIVMIHCTVDPLNVATLTRGHPSYIYI